MTDVAAAWLKKKEYAVLSGHRLRPIENQFLQGEPLFIRRGHSQAFYLKDNNNLHWVLKKFSPGKTPSSAHLGVIKTLIPQSPGFETGYLRQVLTKEDVSTSGFFSDEYVSWIDNTILMSRISQPDWASLIDKARTGLLIQPNDERLVLCRNLSHKIKILEDNHVSHRNLSRTSVFVDTRDQSIHLINWDEIFHPTLAIPPNRTIGTWGYIAPFMNKSGTPDPLISWGPHADRFSLAILNSEFLGLRADSPIHGDGGLFNQDELFARSGEGIEQILKTLRKTFPGADVLLKRALDARSFDECPSPAEWLAFSGGVDVSFVNSGESMPPAKYYSCFISYSEKDNEFAHRLHSRLRDAGLRVWFAPENVEWGRKMLDQVDKAIEMHDRFLVVLSEHSLRSNWVREELRRARKLERASGRLKLFPIRITDYETLQEWSCIDTVTVEDLADEIRSYVIPDFSNWKNYDDFEKAFERLLDALKPDP